MEKYLKPALQIFRLELDAYMNKGTLATSDSISDEGDSKKRYGKEDEEAAYATGNVDENSYGDIW